ncbi:hypothetical protein [Magnetospirillum sp. SS-4]|uniref:hypothetical protein n=1 Tax=Magnetospirillum sp. SS-4 TaxID=2681465 RepID=UPI00138123BF|nr:hypothetical protein [Magnetospirillum sp. SS-4]CAA7613757.1 conserved exported hypothetical protein [Magnetospirillum sp. SS-4]
MTAFRLLSAGAFFALALTSQALAQAPGAAPSWSAPAEAAKAATEMPKMAGSGGICTPGNLIEAFSEGGWYPAVVLDPLRDGRCFVHYENYGDDDDEALKPKHIRARR